MKKILGYVIAAIAVLLMVSCQDFFEKNIEDKTVTVISPLDGAVSPYYAVIFRWNDVSGATEYQIQAVSPSFENPLLFLYDTLISGTTLTLSFNPGSFQWRIRAVNSAYMSNFQTYNFSIDPSTDLGKQQVLLKTPSENAYTNASTITFAWDSVFSATAYNFEIRTSAGVSIFNSTNSSKKAYTFPDAVNSIPTLDDGDYIWSVNASNWYSSTPFAYRNLVVDRVAPAVPQLEVPVNSDTLSAGSISFSWTRPDKTGSPIYDSLFVSTLEDMSSTLYKQRVTDTLTSVSLTAGSYWWRVRSFDLAGNSGSYSSINKITVQ